MGVVAGVVLAVLIARVALSLRPPSLAVPLEWTALTGVTIINPGRDRRDNQTLTMRDGRIESITDRVPDAQLRVRAHAFEHRYVLPGLIDMDVRRMPSVEHLQALFGAFFLYAGVTTVRDVGGLDDGVVALRRRIDAGELPWPRLIACGRAAGGPVPPCPGSRTVRDAAAARTAVDDLAATGANCVAVDRTLTADALAALRAAAAAKQLPLVGEVPASVPLAESALDDVFLVSAAPPAAPAQRLADWLRGWQALDGAGIDALVASSDPTGRAYTSSLSRWSQLARLEDPTLSQDPMLALLPRFYRDVLWPRQVASLVGGAPGVTPAGAPGRVEPATLAAAVAAMRLTVQRLHGAGARVHVGTGTPSPYVVPGVSTWSEMLSLTAAGFSLDEAWVAATRAAGESLGIPQLGTLEPGAPADLLIFGKDPTQDPAALMTLEAVVTRGRLYPKVVLNAYVVGYARYVQGAVYERLSMLLARLSAWWAGDARGGCETL